MRKQLTRFLFFATMILAADSYAQEDQVWCLGASIGGVAGVNESINQSINPQFGFSLEWLNAITQHWSLEANVGFGKLSSPNQGGYSEYSTAISTYDLRIRFSPLDGAWQPFIYAGIGALSYNVSSTAPNASPDAKLNGTTGFLPVGIGLYHPINSKWAIEASIGENPSFSDDPNPVRDDRNDAFWGFKIGISYAFGDGLKQSKTSDEFDLGPRGTSQILTTVTFDSASSRIRPESEKTMSQILRSLNNNEDFEIEFRSYYDNSLDFNASMALTHDRAETLKVWLVSRGISALRISTVGYGPHNPLVQNISPENMQKNRRVEIVRMK